MFEDCKSGLGELFDQVDRSVYIEHVVIRDILAVEFVEHPVDVAEESSVLVRILAVTEHGAVCKTALEDGQLLLKVEIVEDRRIVVRADVECVSGETAALLEGRGALL